MATADGTSMATADGKKLALLTSSEGKPFYVDPAAALQSETIKIIAAGPRAGQPIPVPNVNSPVLAKVVEYLELHAVAASADALLVLSKWDRLFMEANHESLFELVLAADFLEIESLLRLACGEMEDLLAGKSPAEIREMFKVRAEPTPDEMDEIRRDYPWAFE